MEKKKETLPKELKEYKDEPVPEGIKMLIYRLLKKKYSKR